MTVKPRIEQLLRMVDDGEFLLPRVQNLMAQRGHEAFTFGAWLLAQDLPDDGKVEPQALHHEFSTQLGNMPFRDRVHCYHTAQEVARALWKRMIVQDIPRDRGNSQAAFHLYKVSFPYSKAPSCCAVYVPTAHTIFAISGPPG